jgi:hypothetical protein
MESKSESGSLDLKLTIEDLQKRADKLEGQWAQEASAKKTYYLGMGGSMSDYAYTDFKREAESLAGGKEDWVPIAKRLYVQDKRTKFLAERQEEKYEDVLDFKTAIGHFFSKFNAPGIAPKVSEYDVKRLKAASEAKQVVSKSKKILDSVDVDFNKLRVTTLDDTNRLNELLSIYNKSPENFTPELKSEFDKLKVSRELNIKKMDALAAEYKAAYTDVQDYSQAADLAFRSYSLTDKIPARVLSSVLSVAGSMAKLNSELTVNAITEKIVGKENSEEIISSLPSFIQPLVSLSKIRQNASNSLSETFFEASEQLTNLVELRQQGTEVKSFEDAAEFVTDLFSEQAVNTAITAGLPGIGLALISASASGKKMRDMDIEIEKGKKISPLQYYGAALMYGGAEYITEKVALDQFLGLKEVAKTFNLDPRIALKTATYGKALKKYAINVNKEGIAEFSAQLLQNGTDKYVLKNDVHLLENTKEAYLSGAVMSGLGFSAPVLAVDVYRAYTVPDEVKAANKLYKEMETASAEFDRLMSIEEKTDDVKAAIEIQKNKIDGNVEKLLAAKKLAESRINDLSSYDKRKINKAHIAEYNLKKEIEALNSNMELSDQEKKNQINDRIKKINDLQSKRTKILNSALISKDVTRLRKKKIQDELAGLTGKINYINASDVDEAKQKAKAKATSLNLDEDDLNELISQIDKLGLDAEGNAVEFNGATIGGEFNAPFLFVNRNNANENNPEVVSHEVGHITMESALFSGNNDAINLVNESVKYAAKNYKGAAEKIEAIDRAYRSRGYSEREIAKEKLVGLIEYVRGTDISKDRTFQGKLFDMWSKVVGKDAVQAVTEIKTGKDVFTMIQDFAYAFDTGEISKSTKSLILGEVDVRQKATAAEESNNVQYSITPEQNDSLSKIHEKGSAKILRSPIATKLISKVAKSITQKFYDPIAPDAKRGVDREEYEVTAQTELSLIAMEWDPTKQDFGKFLANRGFLRLSDLAKRLGIESTEEYGGIGIAVDVETSKEAQSEFADEQTDAEVSTEAQVKDKTSFAEGLPISGIKDAIIASLTKASKLSITKYTEQVSKNVTVTPFVSSVKEYLAENVKKEVKAWVNQYGYEKFLTDFKDLILDNYTTTYLSKHPLFKAGIQKSINGKFVSPVEVKPGVFDFVDKDGNKYPRGTFDRETAGVAGKTSGPEIIRRNPNIKNIITEKMFVDYHFDDGAKRSKKKQNPEDALVRQLAAEIGFDLLKDDLLSNGPISSAINEVADLRGIVLLEADIEKVAKSIDRGSVKYSLLTGEDVRSVKPKMKDLIKINKESDNNPNRFVNFFTDVMGFSEEKAKELNKIFTTVFDLLQSGILGVAKTEKEARAAINNLVFNKVADGQQLYILAGGFSRDFARKESESAKEGDVLYGNKEDGSLVKITKAGQKYIEKEKDRLNTKVNAAKNKEDKINIIQEYLANEATTLAGTQSTFIDKITGKKYKSPIFLKTQQNIWDAIVGDIVVNNELTDEIQIRRGKKSQIKINGIGVLEKRSNLNITNFRLTDAANRGMAAQNQDAFNEISAISEQYLRLRVDEFIDSKDIQGLKEFLSLQIVDMNSALRKAAFLQYVDKNALVDIASTGQLLGNRWVWEHMTPASFIARLMMGHAILPDVITKQDLDNAFKHYKVAIINKKLDKNLLNSTMGDLYTNIGMSPEATRYFELIQLGLFNFDNYITPSNTLETTRIDYSLADEKTFLSLQDIPNVYFHGTAAEVNEDFIKTDIIKEFIDGASTWSKSAQGFGKFYSKSIEYAESYSDHRIRKDETTTVAAVEIKSENPKRFNDLFALFNAAKKMPGNTVVEKNKNLVNRLKQKGFDAIVFKEGPSYNPDLNPMDVIIPLTNNKNLIGQADYNTRNGGIVKDRTIIKYSLSDKDVNTFDSIVSRKTGLKGEIGEAIANRLGKNKGKFKFFVPPSADDFMGLMYYLVGSGKQGDKDLEFIKNKLVDPFATGVAALESYKQNKLSVFRDIKKSIKGNSNLKLSKENKTGFTNEQSIRIYLWAKKGYDIPDITEAEQKSVMQYINSTPELLDFAKQMQNLFIKEDGYPEPQGNWFAGTMTIDILNYINDTSRSEFLKDYIENFEALFGKLGKNGEITGPMANKLRASYGNNYIEALSDVLYRMKNGRGREFGKNRLANKFNNWISNAVGSIMFLNTRSALLQQVSLVNFINLSDNNPIAFAQAISNTKQYAADYTKLLNSDFLKQRRGGLAIDVNEDEIARAAESGGNSLSNIISVILKKGFVLTTWADSHAIASGGATFYRNRINTYVKQGLSIEEAESKAFFEFKELAEESQQSSRPDKISQQQASSLGRIILAFANTPMQYARITKKAALDLINGRGDWKTNTSKLLYYGALQNIMFTYMQQALFALAFGDEEEEDKKDEDRYIFAANGMADGFLRGLGFGGAVAATAKNMVLEAIEQEQNRKDYDEVVWKALTLSPPLSSKIDKARSVARTFTWKQQREKIFTEGVSLDNPIFEAAGKTTSVLTNIPLDRVIRKADNITTPLRQDVEFWQAFALYMGYGKYELGLYESTNKKPASKGGKSGKKVMPRYK